MKNLLSILLTSFLLLGCHSLEPSAYEAPQDTNKKLIAANANIQLGMNYLQDQEVAMAKQKFLLALELAPKYPPAWYTMAYYLEVTGDKTKANDYYKQAIALAPNRGDSLNNYGTFLCHSGQARESINYFLKATKDPNYIETSAAYENAGLCALKIPDNAQAIEYFNKAVASDPKRDTSLFELARLNYQQGHYALAKHQVALLQAMQKPAPTLALNPKNTDYNR